MGLFTALPDPPKKSTAGGSRPNAGAKPREEAHVSLSMSLNQNFVKVMGGKAELRTLIKEFLTEEYGYYER